MKKNFLLLCLALFIKTLLQAQCPEFPNGNMEKYYLDSMERYNTPDSFTYLLKIDKWQSYTCFDNYSNRSKTEPDSCTYTDDSYSGNTALRVPFDQYLLIDGLAFLADTINGIPSSISGYYHSKKGLDSIDTDLFILFHDYPTSLLNLIDSSLLDSSLAFYHKKLLSTNGVYEYFELPFDDKLKEVDSFLIVLYFDAEELWVDFSYPEIYIDDLEFGCTTDISNEKWMPTYSLEVVSKNNWTVKTANRYNVNNYSIFNLNGQVIRSGKFIDELNIQTKDEFWVIKIFNANFQATFKLF